MSAVERCAEAAARLEDSFDEMARSAADDVRVVLTHLAEVEQELAEQRAVVDAARAWCDPDGDDDNGELTDTLMDAVAALDGA